LIIPGIVPILGYDKFHRTLKFTKTMVAQEILDKLETLKGNDEKVREYGVEVGINQSRDLLNRGCRFIHFYTMNLEASVIKIIKGLGILNKQRDLPFKPVADASK